MEEHIRKLTVQALSSDDSLMEQLILKGGNLLSLIYGLTDRASTDLDYSLAKSDLDVADFERRIKRALEKTFKPDGFIAFDLNLSEKPKTMGDSQIASFWGGYELSFKVISEEKHQALNGKLDAIRRQSIPLGIGGSTKMKVDISKFEYVDDSEIKEIDGFAVRVYSPAMVVCEKLRAICQQMDEYKAIIKSQKASPRPRDFFDIYQVAKKFGLDFSTIESRKLLKAVFAAKRVPIDLIPKIKNTYEFHNQAYPELQAVVSDTKKLGDFQFYFDYTLKFIQPLLDHSE